MTKANSQLERLLAQRAFGSLREFGNLCYGRASLRMRTQLLYVRLGILPTWDNFLSCRLSHVVLLIYVRCLLTELSRAASYPHPETLLKLTLYRILTTNETPSHVVEQQIDNYISEEITITDAYQFSQYKTIQQIENFMHSKFTSGQFDSRGNPKPFFNITKGKVNIAIRATDIDRKDIKNRRPFVPVSHRAFAARTGTRNA